jgi:hypothetical protein
MLFIFACLQFTIYLKFAHILNKILCFIGGEVLYDIIMYCMMFVWRNNINFYYYIKVKFHY